MQRKDTREVLIGEMVTCVDAGTSIKISKGSRYKVVDKSEFNILICADDTSFRWFNVFHFDFPEYTVTDKQIRRQKDINDVVIGEIAYCVREGAGNRVRRGVGYKVLGKDEESKGIIIDSELKNDLIDVFRFEFVVNDPQKEEKLLGEIFG